MGFSGGISGANYLKLMTDADASYNNGVVQIGSSPNYSLLSNDANQYANAAASSGDYSTAYEYERFAQDAASSDLSALSTDFQSFMPGAVDGFSGNSIYGGWDPLMNLNMNHTSAPQGWQNANATMTNLESGLSNFPGSYNASTTSTEIADLFTDISNGTINDSSSTMSSALTQLQSDLNSGSASSTTILADESALTAAFAEDKGGTGGKEMLGDLADFYKTTNSSDISDIISTASSLAIQFSTNSSQADEYLQIEADAKAVSSSGSDNGAAVETLYNALTSLYNGAAPASID